MVEDGEDHRSDAAFADSVRASEVEVRAERVAIREDEDEDEDVDENENVEGGVGPFP